MLFGMVPLTASTQHFMPDRMRVHDSSKVSVLEGNQSPLVTLVDFGDFSSIVLCFALQATPFSPWATVGWQPSRYSKL